MNLLNDLKVAMKPYLDKYHLLPQKQQSQYLLCGVMVGLLLIQVMILAPMDNSYKILKGKTDALRTETEQHRTMAQNILIQVQQSIANPRSNESVKLLSEIEALNAGLAVYYQDTVSPSEMGGVLRELLSEDKKLTFIRMNSIPTVEVLMEKPEFSEFTKIEKRPKLYKRGIEIVFKGTYEGTFAYLKRIEGYRKKLFWDHILYDVKEYPFAQVTMTVYTLTDEESWIGS